MKRLTLLLSILVVAIAGLKAQQDPVVSQYMFNHLLLNPAYAGTHPYFSATLLHRSQWVGWEGAPRSQVFTFQGPLPDRKSGIGLTLANDHLGVTNRVDAFLNYAYAIRFNENAALSLGLKGGISAYSADFTKLTYWDQGDQIYSQGKVQSVLPQFGAGAFFHTPRFYAGISAPSILSYDPREVFSIGSTVSALPHIRRHFYLTAGYAWEVGPRLVVKPSVCLRYVKAGAPQADINLNFLINRVFWVGASYRTGDALVGLLEFQATRKLRFGYAYDYTLTDVGRFSSGSHELMLSYDFGYDILKMKTPRYF